MNAKDCIKERRSIRKFKADPVDHALLSEIVETASYAPSWKHTQIARYIAVEGDLKLPPSVPMLTPETERSSLRLRC